MDDIMRRITAPKNTAHKIVEVSKIFYRATAGWIKLTSLIQRNILCIKHYSPLEMLHHCEEVQYEQQQLETDDKQILQILELAGEELAECHETEQYYKALQDARKGYDVLLAMILHIRAEALDSPAAEDSLRYKPLDSSLAGNTVALQ
jgi:hypothetical protein